MARELIACIADVTAGMFAFVQLSQVLNVNTHRPTNVSTKRSASSIVISARETSLLLHQPRTAAY